MIKLTPLIKEYFELLSPAQRANAKKFRKIILGSPFLSVRADL